MSLPELWKHSPIKTVTTLLSGGTPLRTNLRFFGGEIPWVTPVDITTETQLYLQKAKETVTEQGIRTASLPILERGTVLMTARASVGAVAIASERTTTSQDLINFIPTANILNSEYLAYLIRFSSKEILRYSTGTTFSAVSQSGISKWRIPVPPLLEQERIVSILEQAEKIRSLQKEAQAKARELQTTLFQEMFLLNSNREKWQLKTVGQVGEVQLGRQRSPQYQTGRYTKPYLRVANVLDDEFDLSERTGILEMDFDTKDFERYCLEYGDILLNEGQSIDNVGRSAMWKAEIPNLCYQNHLIRFRANREIVLPEYMQSLFSFFFRKDVFSRLSTNTSNLATLGLQRLANIEFRCPPIELQDEFNRRILLARSILKLTSEKMVFSENIFQNVSLAVFSGTLTQKWREQPDIAPQLEQQARERDEILSSKTAEIPEDNTSESSLPDDLSDTNLRAGFASHAFEQLRDNQKIRLQPPEEIKLAQYIDTFLRIVDLELQPHTEKAMLETPSQLMGFLQESEDPVLQEIADTLSSLDFTTRAEFNPNNPRHPRAYFWQEVSENSPLRMVYNAFRIAQGYCNLQTIVQTLEDLNEPLEEHRIARAIDTLESTGLIEAIVLEMPSQSNFSETRLIPAYRLPDLESPKFALPPENL